MGIFSGLLGGITSLFSGNEEGRRIERGGRRAEAALERGRDYAINESGLSDFRDTGTSANALFADLIGLGDNAAGQTALNKYKDTVGYQAQLEGGQDAIAARQAASGKFNSGATGKGLVQFGSELGQRTFNDFLGNVNTQANRGLSAASNLTSAVTGSQAQSANTAFQSEAQSAAARRSGQDGAFEGLGHIFGSI